MDLTTLPDRLERLRTQTILAPAVSEPLAEAVEATRLLNRVLLLLEHPHLATEIQTYADDETYTCAMCRELHDTRTHLGTTGARGRA